jgi:hypothetical protein
MTIASENFVVFSVAIDTEAGENLRQQYERLRVDIPLIVRYSPCSKIVEPLLEYIESEEYNYKKGDIITVLLPQLEVSKWWQRILHNQTRLFIAREL